MVKRLFTNKSLLRVLSGLFTNLSAAALGLVIFTPNFIPLNTPAGLLSLTYDIVFAIVFLLVAVILDEKGNI